VCTDLYVTVPRLADLSTMVDLRLRLTPSNSSKVASIKEKLLAGEVLCHPRGIPECSAGGFCGTVLGRAKREAPESMERAGARETAKLKRLGWSEARILRRALQQQQQPEPPAIPSHLNQGVDELAIWQEFLETCLLKKRIEWIGILVTTYGQEHRVPKVCEMAPLKTCDLTSLQSGVLYRLQRGVRVHPSIDG
jgi:hypothetical protein